jgi:hypothetical protein
MVARVIHLLMRIRMCKATPALSYSMSPWYHKLKDNFTLYLKDKLGTICIYLPATWKRVKMIEILVTSFHPTSRKH